MLNPRGQPLLAHDPDPPAKMAARKEYAIYVLGRSISFHEAILVRIGNINCLFMPLNNFILHFQRRRAPIARIYINYSRVGLSAPLHPFGDFEGHDESVEIVFHAYEFSIDGMALEDGWRLSDFLSSELDHKFIGVIDRYVSAPEPRSRALYYSGLRRQRKNRRSQTERSGEGVSCNSPQAILIS